MNKVKLIILLIKYFYFFSQMFQVINFNEIQIQILLNIKINIIQ